MCHNYSFTVTIISVWIFLATLFTTYYKSNISLQEAQPNRSFVIDYEHDRFLKDGEPFRYVSGSMHYFRVPRVYWRDRLRKLRTLGLNTVQTYIEWSTHEPLPGQYDFNGQNDIEEFIKLASEEGLLVILRPGPYICSERDLGGYPAWLFTIDPKIFLRTSDATHRKYVTRWFNKLFPKLQPLLYGNGGPIIMLQVENEYGSYVVCDREYTTWLRDLFLDYVEDKAILFTTDGNTRHYLRCTIPGVFATVDFGPRKNVSKAFSELRNIQKKGPLVNSEFYVGHLSHWGEPPTYFPGFSPSLDDIVNSTRQLLQLGASFNFYMMHGGTNFGYTSGANLPYHPQITSYENGAPISESGQLTPKYYAIKAVLSEFLPIPDIKLSSSRPASYGTLVLEPKISLFDSDTAIPYGVSEQPRTFERLEQYSGLLLYETPLPGDIHGSVALSVEGIHDRTIVFIDQKIKGVLSRTHNVTGMDLFINTNTTLGLLVENEGHINYMNMSDHKGLVSDVTLDGAVLNSWNHSGYPMKDVSHISTLPSVNTITLPGYFSGSFRLNTCNDLPDTFIDMTGWTKGFLFVNGFSLGRYWPVQGPQVTLYCPGSLLQCENTVVVLELEAANSDRTIKLIDYSILKNVSKPEYIDVGDDVYVRNI